MMLEQSTVNSTEKKLERSQETKAPRFHKLPDMKPVTTARIQNFTCPGCKELLPEVTSINSRVQGWCGRSHTFINQKI